MSGDIVFDHAKGYLRYVGASPLYIANDVIWAADILPLAQYMEEMEGRGVREEEAKKALIELLEKGRAGRIGDEIIHIERTD